MKISIKRLQHGDVTECLVCQDLENKIKEINRFLDFYLNSLLKEIINRKIVSEKPCIFLEKQFYSARGKFDFRGKIRITISTPYYSQSAYNNKLSLHH